MSFKRKLDTVIKEFDYQEGQILATEELILYALMKTTANPFVNPRSRQLTEDNIEILKLNCFLVCKSLGKIYHASYDADDLYSYLCCMMKLESMDNPTLKGLFDGMPRIDYFAPYVDLLLLKCAYSIIRILNGASNCISEVLGEAEDICKQIVEGTVSALVPPKSFTTEGLRFSSMHLLTANFPHWKYQITSDTLVLWKPYPTKPYQSEKVVTVHSDLTWSIKINGKDAKLRWLMDPIVHLQMNQNFIELMTEVDEAHVCQGIPITNIQEAVDMCFKHGSFAVQDVVKARIDGDFVKSEKCHLLVKVNGEVSMRACNECSSKLPAVLEKHVQSLRKETDKTSFQMETLNTISRLNLELRKNKQQMVSLWEQFCLQKIRLKQVEEDNKRIAHRQPQTVRLHDGWLTEQRKVRKDVIKEIQTQSRLQANQVSKQSVVSIINPRHPIVKVNKKSTLERSTMSELRMSESRQAKKKAKVNVLKSQPETVNVRTNEAETRVVNVVFQSDEELVTLDDTTVVLQMEEHEIE